MSTPVRSAPRATIDAPPIQVPTAGLTNLAHLPAIPDERWLAGYTYRTEYPTLARSRSQNTATLGTNVINDRGPELIDTIPIALTIVDEHSAFNFNLEDLPKRAERILEAFTSRLLERELWTGEIAIEDDLPNRRFESDDTIDVSPGTAPSPQDAIAIIMDAISEAGGSDGMIHMPRSTAIRTPEAWKNDETLDKYGFVIVSGAGYPGTGPDGTGTGWVYGTAIVNVRLGPIELVPEEIGQATRTSDNKIMYYAQRFAAADFAGPVFACQVSDS